MCIARVKIVPVFTVQAFVNMLVSVAANCQWSCTASSSSSSRLSVSPTLKTAGPVCLPRSCCWCYVWWGASPCERRNSSVFSASKDGSEVIDGGRLFHTFTAATGKARSPMVVWFVRGTSNDADDAERSRLRESMSEMRCSSRTKYNGAVPLRQRWTKTARRNSIRCGTLSQWRSRRRGDTCSLLLAA